MLCHKLIPLFLNTSGKLICGNTCEIGHAFIIAVLYPTVESSTFIPGRGVKSAIKSSGSFIDVYIRSYSSNRRLYLITSLGRSSNFLCMKKLVLLKIGLNSSPPDQHLITSDSSSSSLQHRWSSFITSTISTHRRCSLIQYVINVVR
ncbi:unnamed protein product [Arabidopsis thaliana]|uniref:Uncharacterized protein n=1 Tax=Arabidopsis thaliana TaxID=3702 RepID=Q9LSK0_ARATH|nr:unnamed protein product [Arabidopsis thaliana]